MPKAQSYAVHTCGCHLACDAPMRVPFHQQSQTVRWNKGTITLPRCMSRREVQGPLKAFDGKTSGCLQSYCDWRNSPTIGGTYCANRPPQEAYLALQFAGRHAADPATTCQLLRSGVGQCAGGTYMGFQLCSITFSQKHAAIL